MGKGRLSGRTSKRADSGISSAQAARWVALDLNMYAPRTWFGPSWALLSGAVYAGLGSATAQCLIALAVAWVATELVLGALLDLSIEIAELRNARPAEPPPAPRWNLPYMQPASPGARVLRVLADRRARFSAAWQVIDGAGRRWLLLALVALALAAVGGGMAVLLVGLALLGLALMAMGGPVRSDTRELAGGLHFLLAWLIGCSALGGLDASALAIGVAFALVWYAWTQRPPAVWLLAAAHGALAAYLFAVRSPLSAAGVLLLAVPLFALEPESPSSQRAYLPQTQLYLMASLLLAAWGAGRHL